MENITSKPFQSFDNIKDASFKLKKVNEKLIGYHYWSSFSLKINNKNVNYVELQLPKADEITLYIPYQDNNYKKIKLGLSIPKNELTHIDEITKLILSTKEIDFTKPFFLNNKPMSIFGFNSLNQKINIVASFEKPTYLDDNLKQLHYKKALFNFEFYSIIGMIFICFMFFLMHYFLTKKVYFLFYALYLFFLFLNYSHRTFYFYDYYAKIHPHLYFYLNQIGAVLGNLFYMFFIYYFIDIKVKYPKLQPIYLGVLKISIVFIIIYLGTIIFNPYYKYHEVMIDSYIYILSVLNFGFVFYMIIKKPIIHTTLVFIGSILLLTGFVLAILNNNFFIMVPIVILESFIFMSVISYLDFKYYKQALERDKLLEINEFKSKMYGNISHEFKTPLTLINGLSSILIEESNNPENRAKLKGILNSGNQLLNLVNQMLGLISLDTQKEAVFYKNGDIVMFLKKGMAVYQNVNYKAQEFNFSSNVEELIMDYDDDKLQKIINNLMSNAIKFTPNNGEISLELIKETNFLTIKIKDTGTGIEAKHLPHIFERYYKTFDTENNLGSGIGMALTKDLVELLNGTIEVHSIINKGSVFTIKLPIQNNINETKNIKDINPNISFLEENTFENTETVNKENTILVVEDNVVICNFIKTLLGKTYTIHTANNGIEGLGIAKNKKIDFIISDVMMPKMDGLEFCKAIKSNIATSHIPFIIISAKTTNEDRLKGYKLGIDAYLNKPFNNDELRLIVKNLLLKKKDQISYFKNLLDLKESKKQDSINRLDIDFIKEIQEIALSNTTINADEIARKLATSRTQLHRKIKSLTGKSITQYINHVRIEKGKELLKNQTLNITEIAYELGFESTNYFSRVFKKETGISPLSFRENLIK